MQEKLEKNNFGNKIPFQLYPDFPETSFYSIIILILSYRIWIKIHGQAYSKRGKKIYFQGKRLSPSLRLIR